MSGQLGAGMRLAPLVQWMTERGLTGADLEMNGDLLIVKLPSESRSRLLADATLRDALVAQGKALGFSRVVLEVEGGRET